MRLRFHAFGHGGHAELPAEVGDGSDQDRAVRPLEKVADEGAVDLDLVEREGPQMGQR